MAKQFIVKVQLSLSSTDGFQHCLIYNKKRDISWQGVADPSLKEAMNGEPKQFFLAHLDGTLVMLDEKTEWQDW